MKDCGFLQLSPWQELLEHLKHFNHTVTFDLHFIKIRMNTWHP